jgi:alkanesulfonate monooxygenase SsuD/methylene tetrahydromethanopterin reductase-like flavin-dependent oxidoreductase (luciferase family)
MALAIIGGHPERFTPFAELHRRATTEGGHGYRPLSINSHGFIAETSQEAVRISFPAFKAMMDRIGRERGWAPLTREQYLASHELRGANFVGSPEQIVEKILFQHELFRHDRFLLQMSVGTLPHKDVMRAIELLGTEVAPKVREALRPQAANR